MHNTNHWDQVLESRKSVAGLPKQAYLNSLSSSRSVPPDS